MKKVYALQVLLVAIFIAGYGMSCGKFTGTVVLEAQALPATKILVWDANPASDEVINYTVRFDGVIIGSPIIPEMAFTITTVGAHNLSVTATNLWGTSTPTTLNFTVIIPGNSQNLRILR